MAEDTAEKADQAFQESTASMARLERRVALLEKERDGLKRIVASYLQDSSGAEYNRLEDYHFVMSAQPRFLF